MQISTGHLHFLQLPMDKEYPTGLLSGAVSIALTDFSATDELSALRSGVLTFHLQPSTLNLPHIAIASLSETLAPTLSP